MKRGYMDKYTYRFIEIIKLFFNLLPVSGAEKLIFVY